MNTDLLEMINAIFQKSMKYLQSLLLFAFLVFFNYTAKGQVAEKITEEETFEY